MIDLNAKLVAATEAVRLVKDGQVIGLGSGTTTELAIVELGKRIRTENLEIVGIPTSKRSESVGKKEGIPISSLDEHDKIDLTIDGADEVDPTLDLIKGLGGALLREKIVAMATEKEIIVVDDSKLVDQLGAKAPLPVEIVQFSNRHLSMKLSSLGCTPKLRMGDSAPFVTDNGNYILDCAFNGLSDAKKIDEQIKAIPGVVETGLFLGIADLVIVGSPTGVRTLRRDD